MLGIGKGRGGSVGVGMGARGLCGEDGGGVRMIDPLSSFSASTSLGFAGGEEGEGGDC